MQPEHNEIGISMVRGEKFPHLTMTYELVLSQVRLWRIISAILLLLSFLLVIGIITIMPLKEVQVRYVEFLSGRDVYFNMHPAKITREQKQALITKALRNYVSYANISDPITLRPRFAEIKAMSTPALYSQMQSWYKNLRENLRDDDTREVNITYAQPVTDKIFEVEFETIDNIRGAEAKRTWVAKLEYEVNDKNIINTEEAVYNPLGIKVKQYNITERVK